MMEPPLRSPLAVDVLMRRRLSGRVERLWHPLGDSAIGIDARQGRDPVVRGSVRSTRAQPPKGDRPTSKDAYAAVRLGLTLDSSAAMLPGVTALRRACRPPCGRRTLWPPMVAIALFGTCDLQICLNQRKRRPRGGWRPTWISKGRSDALWKESQGFCDGGRLGQYAHGRSGKERARRMMVFFDIGRRAVEGQRSECRASKLGRLARTGNRLRGLVRESARRRGVPLDQDGHGKEKHV